VKSKRRSIESVDDETVPIYNAGERCGPHTRGYVEVKLNQIMECAWRKNLQPISELESTQEEADTRILLHAAHAAKSRFALVVIVSEDTDVLVLLLAFKSFIPSSVFIKSGSQTRVKYIDISRVVERVGASVCRSLPGFHATLLLLLPDGERLQVIEL